MTRLEEVKAGVAVRGITPEGIVKVVGVEWYGDWAIKVVYEDGGGTPGSRLIYRNEFPIPPSIASSGRSGIPALRLILASVLTFPFLRGFTTSRGSYYCLASSRLRLASAA